MEDAEMIKKLIGIVVNESYDKEFDLLRWLFRKYEECEKNNDTIKNQECGV